MNSRRLLFLPVLSILGSCTSNTPSGATAQEQVSVTSVIWRDTVLNLGTATTKDKLSFAFYFRNTGKIPLVFEKVESACGCTLINKPEKPILPGAEDSLTGTLNAALLTGFNLKKIYLLANTEPAFQILTLQCDVKE